MRLAVKPDVDLPTMPTIRVYAVIGFPKVPEYKKRWPLIPILIADDEHSNEAV